MNFTCTFYSINTPKSKSHKSYGVSEPTANILIMYLCWWLLFIVAANGEAD